MVCSLSGGGLEEREVLAWLVVKERGQLIVVRNQVVNAHIEEIVPQVVVPSELVSVVAEARQGVRERHHHHRSQASKQPWHPRAHQR